MSDGRYIWPVVVVGAGAAGLTAAIFAGRAQAACLVLDGRRHPGAKIRASGGGRCNVLPSQASAADFFTSGSTNTLRNILKSWPLNAMRKFFEQDLQLPLALEASGKLFPVSEDARDVTRVLFDALNRVHAELRTGCKVIALTQVAGLWRLQLEGDPQPVWAKNVVLATGGLSMPTTGSDGVGLKMAALLGHTMVPTAPALVPLLGRHESLTGLSGLSCEVQLTATPQMRQRPSVRVNGSLLFTHKGYSGPAVLNISQFVMADVHQRPTATLHAAFGLPAGLAKEEAGSWHQLLTHAKGVSVNTVLRAHLPRRLADGLVAAAALSGAGADGSGSAAQLQKACRIKLLELLCCCPMPVSGSEGYRTAEVTVGGVSLNDVVGRTLESRLHRGLYFAGEMLDVTGKLGGYNFMWAWASGRKAGEAAAAACLARHAA